MKQLLFDLCRIGGVSGSEEPIAKFCAEKLSAFADTTIDKKQNILTAYGQTITNKAKTSEQSSTNNLTIFALNTASKNKISYYHFS